MRCQLLLLCLMIVQIYCGRLISQPNSSARYPKIGFLFAADVSKVKSVKPHPEVFTAGRRSPRSVGLGERQLRSVNGQSEPSENENISRNKRVETEGDMEKVYSPKQIATVDEELVNVYKLLYLDIQSLHEDNLDHSHTHRSYMERSRRKKRGGHLLRRLALPLLLALKMKTALALPVIFGIVTLIAFKGLWAGLTALGISAALGLKALISSTNKVLYEVRAPPPHYHQPPIEFDEYWNRRVSEHSTRWR